MLPALQATELADAYAEILDHLYSNGLIDLESRAGLFTRFLQQEDSALSHLGNGVIFPSMDHEPLQDHHAITVLARSESGIPFQDEGKRNLAHFLVLSIVLQGRHLIRLEILKTLSQFFSNTSSLEALRKSSSTSEMLKIFQNFHAKPFFSN